MKKYLLIALFIGLASILLNSEAKAQNTLPCIPGTVNILVSQYNNTSDTVTNTATKYLYAGQIKGYQKIASVIVTLNEISGTTGGTITIEASVNNSDWYPYFKTSADSVFTPTDQAAQSYRWKLFDIRDSYIRIKYVGTGTMSDKLFGKLLY